MKAIAMPILPQIGMGPIKFGADRKLVRSILAETGLALGGESTNMDRFFRSALKVEYDRDTVSFIEVSQDKNICCTYKDVDIFSLAARDLFDLVARDETGRHTFDDFQFCFPDQIITVWDAQEQYDYSGDFSRPVYAAVGCGDARYYEAVKRIDSGALDD